MDSGRAGTPGASLHSGTERCRSPGTDPARSSAACLACTPCFPVGCPLASQQSLLWPLACRLPLCPSPLAGAGQQPGGALPAQPGSAPGSLGARTPPGPASPAHSHSSAAALLLGGQRAASARAASEQNSAGPLGAWACVCVVQLCLLRPGWVGSLINRPHLHSTCGSLLLACLQPPLQVVAMRMISLWTPKSPLTRPNRPLVGGCCSCCCCCSSGFCCCCCCSSSGCCCCCCCCVTSAGTPALCCCHRHAHEA